MQVKKAWDTLWTKSIDSINKSYPNLGAALPLVFGKSFKYNLSGYMAYNNKIYYTAQNILVGKLIETPILFSTRKNKSATKFDRFYSKSISNENRKALKALELDEAVDHPMQQLFENPNNYQSGIELMEDFWHNYGFGDGFLFFEDLGELSRDKKPIAIHSLNRNRVEVVESTDDFSRVLSYRYTTWKGTEIPIPKENILHIKHWNPNIGELKGLGVDQIAAMDINLNEQNNIAQGAAFVNGGRGTLFSSDTMLDNQGEAVEKMTAEQMDVLKDTIRRDFQGSVNNRRMYFSNGKVEVQQYGDTLAEMELDKTDESRWKYIYAIVGVPWSLGPITNAATENNVEAGNKNLVVNKVITELRKFDQKLTGICQPWFPGIVALHDLTEFSELAADLVKMKEIFGSPLITVDEHRKVFNYDAFGGNIGKQVIVPSGMMTLEQLMSTEFEDTPNPDDVTAL